MISPTFRAAPALVVREYSVPWRCWRVLLVLPVMMAATMDLLFNGVIVLHGSHNGCSGQTAPTA